MKPLDEKIATVKVFANEILTEAEKRELTVEEVEMLPGYIRNAYETERNKEKKYKRMPRI